MKVNVTFEGGAELSRALAELGDESTVAGRRGLRRAAKELQQELVEAAPRQEKASRKYWKLKRGGTNSAMYGQLFQNIRVREVPARRDNTVVMQVSTGNAFWGSFQEFGTVNMDAKPWMRPVFDRMHNGMIAALGRFLGMEIEKAAKRIERRARKVLPNGRNG